MTALPETIIASELHLNRSDIAALRVTDRYSLHRVVYSLFEDVRTEGQKQSGTTSGIIFADMGGDFMSRRVLMLSDRPPRNSSNGRRVDVSSKEVDPAFLDHPFYRFQVTVNPTRRQNASGKIVPVTGREKLIHWFGQRAKAGWGFEVHPPSLQVDRTEVLQFEKKGRSVTLNSATLQGYLTVTDRQRFKLSFCRGIGRARAFGFGLLQIVPAAINQ